MHPAPNDEPNQIPVADSSQKIIQKWIFFRVQVSDPNLIIPEAHGLYAPGLGLLGSPRLASASLALPAPATTAAALRAARPPKAAGLLLRGAGKASEADARRGKPSKARPGETADEDRLLPGPWPGPIYQKGVIPDFTLPDTLEKNFVRDLASNFSK